MTQQIQEVPQKINIELLAHAVHSKEEEYELQMTPAMRARHHEAQLKLSVEIEEHEEALKEAVKAAKGKIAEKKKSLRKLISELRNQKIKQAGKQYELHFYRLQPPRKGIYNDMGELITWNYLRPDEMLQMDLAIESAVSSIADVEDVPHEAVDMTDVERVEVTPTQDMDLDLGIN